MSLVETPLAGAALAIRHGNTTWTVERELAVRRLWKGGSTAAEISIEIGGTTRNAVIGKLHRLGLTMVDRQNSREPAPRKPRRRPDGFRRLADKRIARPAEPFHKPMMCEPAPEIQTHERIALVDLTAESCRFPLGDPGKPGFGFCNGQHVKGRPYCAGHMRIAYGRFA